MLGLVLEGGGARGSHQAGVITCLLEHGYVFDGVVGTSIGALNGVMVAQNEFDKALELWNKMHVSMVFDFDDDYADKISKRTIDRSVIKYLFGKLKEAVSGGGLDSSKVTEIISAHVDEDKLRSSTIEFGVMTVNKLSKKPYPIFKDEIPSGKVAKYVMASANLPWFKRFEIDGTPYLDGGIYDNLPINMLVDKGYRDIIAIQTKNRGKLRKINGSNVDVQYIAPSDKTVNLMNFVNSSIKSSMTLGYYDGLRYIKGYRGEYYFIDSGTLPDIDLGMIDMDAASYSNIAETLGLWAQKRSYRSDILIKNKIGKLFGRRYKDIASALIKIVEYAARETRVERFRIYTLEELLKETVDKTPEEPTKIYLKAAKISKILYSYITEIYNVQ